MYIIENTPSKKVIDEIVDFILDSSNFRFLAIRGDDKQPKVGQILKKSKDLNTSYGNYGKTLDGTSAYSFPDYPESEVRKSINEYFYLYDYDFYSIVTGDSYTYGDDAHDMVIRNCKVLKTWKA